MKTVSSYKIRGSIVLLLYVLTGTFSSCKKNLLETVNPTSIAYESAFSTPERILAQVNRLYALIKAPNFLGGRAIVFEELRSNEFIVNQPNLNTSKEVS